MADFVLTHGWPLIVAVSVKSLFVLALAGIAALALRRASAAARHLVWRLALIGLLLLPLLSLTLPGWQAPLWPRLPAEVPDIVLTPPSPPANSPPQSTLKDTHALPPVAPPAPLPVLPAENTAPALPWQVWTFGLWLCGAGLTALPVLAGLVGIRRLERNCAPVTDERLLAQTSPTALELGVHRPVALFTGDTTTPMTWGWRRPVILLPVGAGHWPEDRQRAVLLHELAHIARADWPTQMASQAACALYWFNPCVWLAARQARLESERACDDRVLLAGFPAPDYARHLLDVARSLRENPSSIPLPMAQSSNVEGRLHAILGPTQRQAMVTQKVSVVTIVAAVGVLAPLAALHPVARAAAHPAARAGMLKGDPRAVQLLTQTVAVYKALNSYSGDEVAEGGPGTAMPYAMHLTYQRPGQVVADIMRHFNGKVQQRQFLLDDHTLDTHIIQSGRSDQYMHQVTAKYQPSWQILNTRETIMFPITVELMENGDDFLKELQWPNIEVRLGKPDVVGGSQVDTVIVQNHGAHSADTRVFQIGHADHLLRRFMADGMGPSRPPFHTVQTFLNIRVNTEPLATSSRQVTIGKDR